MYVIEYQGGYLTGINFGMIQTTSEKFGALKFSSEYDATQFMNNNGIYTTGEYNIVPTY